MSCGGVALMSVHEFCRFCHKPLKVRGVFSHSIKIFEKAGNVKTFFERLAGLGLTLTKTPEKSIRTCKNCDNLLSRLERDLPHFRRWVKEEKQGCLNVEESASTTADKRSLKPTPPKRFCPSPPRKRSITEVDSGAPSISSESLQSSELSESGCNAVDLLSEHFHQETELSSTTASKSVENKEKTIVYDRCLMELFKKCQMCGQPVNKTTVSHCGMEKKVRWSCLGRHRGIWMSRTEGEIFAKVVQKTPKACPLHISDPLKKIKSQSRRRGRGALPSWSRDIQRQQAYTEHWSEPTHVAVEVGWQNSFEEMEVTIEEDECNNVKNGVLFESTRPDLDSDMVKVTEATQAAAPGSYDSCDEEIYIPLFPQRSKVSEFLLECEEEELEPWQKETSRGDLKARDQLDIKSKPLPLRRNELKLERESPRPVSVNSESVVATSPQLKSNIQFVGSIGTQSPSANSFTILPAGQPQPLQNMVPATTTPEAQGGVQTSEMQPISSSLLSVSNVHCTAPYSTTSDQLQPDQSKSQTIFVPFSLPCLNVVYLGSTGTQINM